MATSCYMSRVCRYIFHCANTSLPTQKKYIRENVSGWVTCGGKGGGGGWGLTAYVSSTYALPIAYVILYTHGTTYHVCAPYMRCIPCVISVHICGDIGWKSLYGPVTRTRILTSGRIYLYRISAGMPHIITHTHPHCEDLFKFDN